MNEVTLTVPANEAELIREQAVALLGFAAQSVQEISEWVREGRSDTDALERATARVTSFTSLLAAMPAKTDHAYDVTGDRQALQQTVHEALGMLTDKLDHAAEVWPPTVDKIEGLLPRIGWATNELRRLA